MLGDLFGNLEKQQKEMKALLASYIVEASSADGMIKVNASADKTIKNIHIDEDYIKNVDKEELEDQLIVACNRALTKAGEKEREEATKLLKDNLPPGMGDLPGMF